MALLNMKIKNVLLPVIGTMLMGVATVAVLPSCKAGNSSEEIEAAAAEEGSISLEITGMT